MYHNKTDEVNFNIQKKKKYSNSVIKKHCYYIYKKLNPDLFGFTYFDRKYTVQ